MRVEESFENFLLFIFLYPTHLIWRYFFKLIPILTEIQIYSIMYIMKSARISTDLGDPLLIKALKQEANQTDQSMTEVLVHALECYFAHRLESKALARASESVFEEWDNPLDRDYDDL